MAQAQYSSGLTSADKCLPSILVLKDLYNPYL